MANKVIKYVSYPKKFTFTLEKLLFQFSCVRSLSSKWPNVNARNAPVSAEINKPVTVNAFDLLVGKHQFFYLPYKDALKLIQAYQTWRTNVIDFLLCVK